MQHPVRYEFMALPDPGVGQHAAAQSQPWPGAHAPLQLEPNAGTIGFALQPPPLQQHQHMAPVYQQEASALAVAQPQGWSYPTPQGMHPLMPAPAAAQSHRPQAPSGAARRVRWNVILPAVWTVALLAAIGLVASDFDRITGRHVRTTTPKPTTTSSKAAETDARSEAQQPQAANSGAERVARISAVIEQIGRQRVDGNWAAVAASIDELAMLTPLSNTFQQLRTKARVEMRVDRTIARAGALHAAGRTDEARALLDRAIKRSPHRRLTAMRAKLGTQTAPAAPTARPAASKPPASNHDHSGHTHPQAAPGVPDSSVRQPAPPTRNAAPVQPPSGRPPTNPVNPGGDRPF